MRGKVIWTPNLLEQIRGLYEFGVSPIEIVSQLSLPIKSCSLSNYLANHGCRMRSRSQAYKIRCKAYWNKPSLFYKGGKERLFWSPSFIEEVRHMYCDLKMSGAEIAQKFGLRSRRKLYPSMKAHGIPLRSLSEAYKLAHQKYPDSYRREAASNWKGGRKVNENGYIMILLEPSDPYYCMAQKSGYVLEHRYIMARHLGRPLESWEVVHHKNRNKSDNQLSNLHLYPSKQHMQSHIEWKLIWRIKQLEQRTTLLEAENTLLRGQVEKLMWQPKTNAERK
jgi:hypothetical protein